MKAGGPGREEGSEMATLEDIARELQVSKSTVSKALNGAKDVSKAMRQAVLEKAVEMGYSRIPRSARAPKLAVFITDTMEYTRPEDFGYDIIVGFRKAAEPAGFQVELEELDRNLQLEMRYDEYMVLQGYSGALFLGLDLNDPWLKEFESCRTPTVLYDNYVGCNPNVTRVSVDNWEGMELAVAYLRAQGHRKIGYLGSYQASYIYQQRHRAFLRAMENNGLATEAEMTGIDYHISDCLSKHLPRLLEGGCTAIACSHDMLAHGVMLHCRELGLRIPEDISIVGFDDVPICRYTVPPLTTIRQNRTELGKSSFFALSSQLNRVPLSTFLLHAELIERESCAMVRG